MTDEVILARIRHALETGGTPDLGPRDMTDPERALYYRELAYMGYSPSAICNACGWNAKRLQSHLRERAERRTGHLPTAPTYLEARHVDVESRPGAVILTVEQYPVIVEDTPENLLQLGRLVYGAAAAQFQEAAS